MDLDDIIKYLIPKSKRKALKYALKKDGIFGVLRLLFGGSKKQRSYDKDKREYRRREDSRREYRRREEERPFSKPRSDERRRHPLEEAAAQAHTYQREIAALAAAAEHDSMNQFRLQQLSARVDDWVATVDELVARTLSQADNQLMAAERKRVPEAIKRLEKQLKEAKDPALEQKLTRTLENRRQQLALLEQADTNQQLAALKVENTLAHLGMIYSQLHSGQYMLERNSYERLSAEVAEEKASLDDYLTTLSELQGGM